MSSLGSAYVCAEAGIVAWNAVSKTATCGAAEKTSRATRIPWRWAGLCSGAIGITFSITASTVESMIAGAVIDVPPCTTRCPTTSMSDAFAIGPPSAVSWSTITRSAAAWSAMSTCAFTDVPSAARWRIVASAGSPIRSVRPAHSSVASRVTLLTSYSPYLTDDEPALSTSARAEVDDEKLRRATAPRWPTSSRRAGRNMGEVSAAEEGRTAKSSEIHRAWRRCFS